MCAVPNCPSSEPLSSLCCHASQQQCPDLLTYLRLANTVKGKVDQPKYRGIISNSTIDLFPVVVGEVPILFPVTFVTCHGQFGGDDVPMAKPTSDAPVR